MDDKVFYDEKQTAKIYFNGKITAKGLQAWRLRGGGPPFVKLGRRVVYCRADLDAWVESRKRQTTSQVQVDGGSE